MDMLIVFIAFMFKKNIGIKINKSIMIWYIPFNMNSI